MEIYYSPSSVSDDDDDDEQSTGRPERYSPVLNSL